MRVGVLASALLAGATAGLAAQGTAPELRAEARAFVEVEPTPNPCYLGEVIAVRLRVGVDARFFAEQALQLFHRRLDVPVQVEVGWPGPPEATAIEDPEVSSGPRLTLALSDAVVAATRAPDETRDDRPFTVLTVTRRFVAAREGALELPLARLRFAYTTRFVDDFVQGRVGVDRHEIAIESPPAALRIAPLPDAGRPAAFSGAVGQFTVRADVSVREIDAGASFPLVLRIEGEGNLHSFASPPLGIDGFHVLGNIDSKSPGRRTITYDIQALRAGADGIPPIAFAFFDPSAPGHYRTVTTSPLPLVVRARGRTVTAEDFLAGLRAGRTPGVDDIFAIRVIPFAASIAPSTLRFGFLCALLGPWLLALGIVAWRRARRRAAQDHLGRRARTAAASFRARANTKDSDLADGFIAYLAARLRCAPPAVISPDLGTRLSAAGVPGDLAGRTVATIDALVAARYGSARDGTAEASTSRLVEELERAFTASDTSGVDR